MRYVWLNIQTGEFSNSWDEKQQKYAEPIMQENDHWKLIKYEALNDKNFEFSNFMKIK